MHSINDCAHLKSPAVLDLFEMRVSTIFLAFASLFVHVSCLNQTVFDLIASNTQLSILNSLLDKVPAIRRSISSRVYTFYAPTDGAFAAFNETNPEDFATLQNDANALLTTLQCTS